MSHDAIMVLIPAYLVAQVVTLIIWRGGWRVAAAAPLPVAGALIVQALVAARQGSNLWPILVILFPMLAVIYLTLAALIRAVALRRDAT